MDFVFWHENCIFAQRTTFNFGNMFNFIYSWIINGKVADYKFRLEDAISTIDKYGLWDKDFNHVSIRGAKFFKKIRDGKVIVDIFYDNIHIHSSVCDNEEIYSIRLKSDLGDWVFMGSDDRVDYSHPVNETYEVYVGYLIPILDVTKVDEYRYKHGAWDKYVHIKMEDFFEEIRSYTIDYKLNAIYKKYKKEKAATDSV